MHVAPSLVRGQGAPTWDRHRVCGVQTAREQGRTLSRGRGRRGGRGARSEATRRRAGSSCCPVSRICTGCGCDAETRLASFRHLASRRLLPAPLRRHFGPCTYHSQPSVRVVCIVSVSPWCLARHAGSSVSCVRVVSHRGYVVSIDSRRSRGPVAVRAAAVRYRFHVAVRSGSCFVTRTGHRHRAPGTAAHGRRVVARRGRFTPGPPVAVPTLHTLSLSLFYSFVSLYTLRVYVIVITNKYQ